MRIHSMNCRSLLWEYRYKMALRSVKAAKGAGKSSEEIREILLLDSTTGICLIIIFNSYKALSGFGD